MNWNIFSTIGYVSIGLWLCIPLLWTLHLLFRRRGGLVHIALVFGVVAFVLAKVNSETYVNRIQVDRSEQIQEQLDKQELARQTAASTREDEVAQIRFAEDAGDDFLDKAGMDDADLKYMESFDDTDVPEWKREKKQRSSDAVDDSLEAQIGGTDIQEGVEAEIPQVEESFDPILMTDADKTAADRLDAANLKVIRVMLGLCVLAIIIDYLQRANIYERAYFPLPLPSRWVDSMTPREPITHRTMSPRRTLLEELQIFARRGESFVYITDDATSAAEAATTIYRLPLQRWPVEVVNVANFSDNLTDDFVFETLWYGRNSFVVNSPDRGERMLTRFLELMAERQLTRARVRQTVHIVWDLDQPISAEKQWQFANLGRATGYSLLLCEKQSGTDQTTPV